MFRLPGRARGGQRTEAQEAHRALLSRLYTAGNWFQMPRDFLRVMTPEEAVMLAYLINVSSTVLAIERNDGWFYREMADIANDICLNYQQQIRVMKKLGDKGFIKIKKEGSPPTRYLWIDFDQLHEAIEKTKG